MGLLNKPFVDGFKLAKLYQDLDELLVGGRPFTNRQVSAEPNL